MTDAAAAGLLALAGFWVGMISVITTMMVRNQVQDSYLAWHRSFGAFFSFGYGPRGIALQAAPTRFITLTLFAASLFFALRALFVE